MKIEQLIVQHLYNNKKVTLQDIGTFFLSSDVNMPAESDKEMTMPANAIRFEFDKKAKQDDELISFIVTQTRKIKPLATSDLESYSILARQFINIGKPFPIEGLGILLKNQAGQYEFLQGQFINAKLDAAPALLKEKTEEEMSFSAIDREAPSNKKWMLYALFGFIVIVSVALYFFMKRDDKGNLEKVIPIAETAPAKKDSIVSVTDSSNKTALNSPDSIAASSQAKSNDGFTFKIVIKEYPGKLPAERAFTKLSSYGHKLLLYPKDSVIYKIAMPFTDPLSDTSRAKDSLRIFFGGEPYVEKN